MRKRSTVVRVAGLGLTVVVGAVLSLGVVTWLTRTSGPPVRVASAEGGFSLAVPRGWTVEHRRPIKDDHRDFLVGHENAAFGFLQRGGFWVARWPVSSDASTDTIVARMRADQTTSPRDNWTLATERLAGRAAVTMSFTESPGFAGRLRLGQKRIVIHELIARGFNYQIGLWTLPHAGGVTNALDKIAQSVELFAPRSWTAKLDDTDARLTMPGGWSQHTSDLDGVIFYALAPGDPTYAWVYVFRYDKSPAASLRGALKIIPDNGGTIIRRGGDTLGTRRATRLDFTFPDGDGPPARDTEWFVSDGDGGTFVLAVGRRGGAANIADFIAAGWKH